MSSIIEAEKAKIAVASKRIHEAKITDTKEKLGKLLRSGNDRELGQVCRQMAGLIDPPSNHRKPKVNNPTPTV